MSEKNISGDSLIQEAERAIDTDRNFMITGLLKQGSDVTEKLGMICETILDKTLETGRLSDAVYAGRLVSNYARLLEAMARVQLAQRRLSGPIEQVVTVNHVHVAEGGKAAINTLIRGGSNDN